MSKLSAAFTSGKAFIPFIVAGDPDKDSTVNNIVAMANAGADIIELGIPFSDPVADGPVIQAGDLRAFAGGISVDGIFDIVATARKQTARPIVFLTYANIPFKYGYDKFCKRCSELGVAGLVIPDLPYEEQDEIRPFTKKYGLDLIMLITLNSGDRVAKLAESAEGFIYVVSSEGITGERDEFDQRLAGLFAEIKAHTNVPAALGFGIHTPQQARDLSRFADGIIVGSAIVELAAQYGSKAAPEIGKYTAAMKAAIK
ncbi:tryptophan synthase subunit alpha [Lacticaseibacillus sharpeae]|uniref:Tryptophan synthase alpha chain n=1 Tax=Lacticaseibacillus sharpeae JCM 1186 = DSM 20505 TaxID=1291052 RepID=A0A0R1ZLD3_9LACO|nr:tryptophan synthase subunit alpha [Lacticaseibacillus sharpeae]KRM55790.1 tryptophan synthase subunit alpha [Lacticaseibacillus sharpeae JCM 1186 = DSM 20505]